MESSQVVGNSEECGGNESSWTMYIGSAIQSSNREYDHADASTFIQGQDSRNHANEDCDDESDDSMVSDASSGPKQQKKKIGPGCFEGVDHKQQNRCFLGKKPQKQMKQRDGRKMETAQELVLKANSAASQVRSVNKVRKSR